MSVRSLDFRPSPSDPFQSGAFATGGLVRIIGLSSPEVSLKKGLTPTPTIPQTSPGPKSGSILNKPHSHPWDFIKNFPNQLRML